MTELVNRARSVVPLTAPVASELVHRAGDA
jgi:hypothetical protein